MDQQCSDKAREYFLRNYKKYYGAFMLRDFNKGRHLLIEGSTNIWFVFKKEHFKSFAHQFPEFVQANPEYDGEGDSINKKCLAQAVNYGCKYIVFAHKQDKYYFANPRKLLAFCLQHGLVRGQDRSNAYKEKGGEWNRQNEETFCFPLSYLTEWKFNERLENE